MATQRAAGRGSSRRYTEVEKAQAVRLVRALRAELGTGRGTVRRVADRLGFGVESVRKWVAQAGIDDGAAAGVTTADRSRIRELEVELATLAWAHWHNTQRPHPTTRGPTTHTPRTHSPLKSKSLIGSSRCD